MVLIQILKDGKEYLSLECNSEPSPAVIEYFKNNAFSAKEGFINNGDTESKITIQIKNI